MSFGKRLGDVRKIKKISLEKLDKAIGTISVTVERHECNEAKPSIEVTTRIAGVFEVSLDYLTGNTRFAFEEKWHMIKRVADIEQLSENEQTHLFALMGAFLRDHKTKKPIPHKTQIS